MRIGVAVLLATAIAAGTPSVLPAADGGLEAVVRGGRLYDDCYRELRATPPRQPHPLFKGAVNSSAEAAATWRCTTCHGWDYRGADGVRGIEAVRGAPGARHR